MCAGILKRFLIGLSTVVMLASPYLALSSPYFAEAATGQRSAFTERSVAAGSADYGQNADAQKDRDQSRVDVGMLTRAENRAEALRSQLVNLQMREIELKARIDELDYQMKPESIQQALALVGSVRPRDELGATLRARLEAEKSRTNAKLELVAATRVKLETALRDAEAECERLRQRLRQPQA